MQDESVYAKGIFRFDYAACLRSEYSENECTLCIELCPESAMVFDRSRLMLDAGACTACAACLGSCPTEALMSDAFDPNRFAAVFSRARSPKISCKENVPCIAALSSEHLITLALEKEEGIDLDLAHCEGCAVNREGKVFEAIERAVDEAGRFLKILQKEEKITRRYEVPEPRTDAGRRGLLKKLSGTLEQLGGEESSKEAADIGKKEPLRRTILKNSLKKGSQSFPEETAFQARFSFTAGKKIDAASCTNCQECAMFCPTGALSILQDNTGILFQMGKCIACSICNDVCKPGSIGTTETFDLIDFAFDRMQILVKHTLEICEECKVAFPYRGGKKVCDRCRDFKENFSDLFTLARDME